MQTATTTLGVCGRRAVEGLNSAGLGRSRGRYMRRMAGVAYCDSGPHITQGGTVGLLKRGRRANEREPILGNPPSPSPGESNGKGTEDDGNDASCRLGDPLRLRAGGRVRSGPQVGKVAT